MTDEELVERLKRDGVTWDMCMFNAILAINRAGRSANEIHREEARFWLEAAAEARAYEEMKAKQYEDLRKNLQRGTTHVATA